MIPVCFPQEITFNLDDGKPRRYLASSPPQEGPGAGFDPARIYLALEETLQGLKKICLDAGLAQPVRLPADFLAALPLKPMPLAAFLTQARTRPPARASICLLNGGGGGLGDGIMFAPALDILLRRLRSLHIRDLDLTVYSILPLRTTSILGRIPGVRVEAMPVALSDFMAFDAYADFSGMLDDPRFHSMHMTDFILDRMGIDPLTVTSSEKEPFLNLGGQTPPVVQAALALARAEAGSKPLVAVIFISSYTRTMPDEQAAGIIRELAADYRPVLLFPEGWPAEAFVEQYGLRGLVTDLSPASPTFNHYFSLLAGVDAIVSVDTSAVHLGAAFRKPTVAIFNSIPQDCRIRYSPTVQGIQLTYRGKSCQAPCGLSKARAYVEGKLANGQPFRLECGYACDEAVDRDGILREAVSAIQTLEPSQAASGQESIRQTMASRLHAHLSPCWQTLEATTVLSALAAVTDRVEHDFGRTCPICRARSLPVRIGRYWGSDRCQCRECRAIFAGEEIAPPEGSGRNGQELPSPVPPVQDAAALFRPLLPPSPMVLGVSGADEAWPEAAWREFLAGAAGSGATGSLWDRRPGSHDRKATSGPYDAIVALCLLDCESRPTDLLTSLLLQLKEGGLLLVIARNSQTFRQDVITSQGVSSGVEGPGWERQTLSCLLHSLGLQEIWLGSTPVTWQDIEEAAGELPALTIQPPNRPDLVVRVGGRELAVPLKQHLAQVLQNINGHGQFWLCCARKPSDHGVVQK